VHCASKSKDDCTTTTGKLGLGRGLVVVDYLRLMGGGRCPGMVLRSELIGSSGNVVG